MDTGHTPFLEEIYGKAIKNDVPVVRREMQAFLKTFLLISRPEKILEIGTATGFSALLMAEYAPKPCSVITIENYEKRFAEAEANIASSEHADRISLIKGDALEELKKLEGTFDLIFMDAAKGQYIFFLPLIKKLMKPGSVMIADNVLQDGDIIEPRYIVQRRERTIYKRMREFLYEIKHDPELETSIIPLGDGISLSVMK